MTFIRDVTIGEGESVPPNTTFVKTWRIQNNGKILKIHLNWVANILQLYIIIIENHHSLTGLLCTLKHTLGLLNSGCPSGKLEPLFANLKAFFKVLYMYHLWTKQFKNATLPLDKSRLKSTSLRLLDTCRTIIACYIHINIAVWTFFYVGLHTTEWKCSASNVLISFRLSMQVNFSLFYFLGGTRTINYNTL